MWLSNLLMYSLYKNQHCSISLPNVAKFSEFSEFFTFRLWGTQGTGIVEHPKVSIMLFTFLFDTESSVSNFLVVIDRTIRMTSSASWSNAWVTAVAGRPERRASLSSLGLSQKLREVQRPAVRLSQHFKPFLYIFYSFILCQKKFNDSPLFAPRITLPHHFDETLSMRKKICLTTQK